MSLFQIIVTRWRLRVQRWRIRLSMWLVRGIDPKKW
jgi:hypothetical protein